MWMTPTPLQATAKMHHFPAKHQLFDKLTSMHRLPPLAYSANTLSTRNKLHLWQSNVLGQCQTTPVLGISHRPTCPRSYSWMNYTRMAWSPSHQSSRSIKCIVEMLWIENPGSVYRVTKTATMWLKMLQSPWTQATPHKCQPQATHTAKHWLTGLDVIQYKVAEIKHVQTTYIQ